MSARGRLKLAVLISGRGSNMAGRRARLRKRAAQRSIELVLSDRADAGGLAAAAAGPSHRQRDSRQGRRPASGSRPKSAPPSIAVPPS